MKEKDDILQIFSLPLRSVLERAGLPMGALQEIRLRAGRPLVLYFEGKEVFLTEEGMRTAAPEIAHIVTEQELWETMELIGQYSLYAYEDELRQGYLTLSGGHRVGVAGQVVLEGDKVRTVRHIASINVRLSHQMIGCADKLFPYLYQEEELQHTLIISPPRCGKTTLLRDLIRQISNGNSEHRGRTVGVVDERSEICGCYRGIPGNDMGIRTDILDACPKAEGMMMLVRSMAPEVVAVDELGCYEDIRAIESVIFCGCRLLATVHGSSLEDIRSKPLFERLLRDQVFERHVILGNKPHTGTVQAILDGRGKSVC